VLDEADRPLAAGLGDDAARVLAYLPVPERYGNPSGEAEPATRLIVRIGTESNRETVVTLAETDRADYELVVVDLDDQSPRQSPYDSDGFEGFRFLDPDGNLSEVVTRDPPNGETPTDGCSPTTTRSRARSVVSSTSEYGRSGARRSPVRPGSVRCDHGDGAYYGIRTMRSVAIRGSMSSPADPTFESDVRRQIYEYVERNGAASPSEIRHQVRIETGPPASKPTRSSDFSAERTPMPVAEVREHLDSLDEAGLLTQEEGSYRVALGTDRTTHTTESGTITIRPARHEDRHDLGAVIREVASENTYIVARTIAEAIDHEETLLRHNERQSRVFFVATYTPEEAEENEAGSGVESGSGTDGLDPDVRAGTDGEGKIVGWVHLEGLQLDAMAHIAELTVGVLADRRQEGIGDRLIEHGLEWAANAGYEKVYQTLPATNEEGIDFLESEAWKREATHKDHYRIDGEYVDEVLLATWL
jgi:N-acetylglutamate synthase-like GNAT family acetyltransferase